MAIDPSIIGGLKPFQMETPVNSLAQLLKVQSLQQENQLGQAKLDEHQRGTERTNRLQSTLAGMKFDTPVDEQVGTLQRGGFLTEARSLAESSAKVSKDKRESEKAQLEAMGQKLALGAQILGSAKDQASYDAARQTATQAGLDVTNMPLQFDPAFVQAKRTEGLSALEQVQQHWKKLGYDLDVGKAAEDVRHNKSTESLTAAGQAQQERASLRTDARASETLKQGKTPVGYRQGAKGSLVPIQGGPADPANKPPTEFQGKSAAFGSRAEEADKILTSLTDKYSPAAINSKNAAEGTWLIGGALGAAANKFQLTESDQKAEQAQRDFINAVLRQESGAAIGASEFDNARKQYFPQPGDTAGLKAQKDRNRKLAVQGLQKNAGHAAFSAPAVEDVHSAADAILNGGK